MAALAITDNGCGLPLSEIWLTSSSGTVKQSEGFDADAPPQAASNGISRIKGISRFTPGSYQLATALMVLRSVSLGSSTYIRVVTGLAWPNNS